MPYALGLNMVWLTDQTDRTKSILEGWFGAIVVRLVVELKL